MVEQIRYYNEVKCVEHSLNEPVFEAIIGKVFAYDAKKLWDIATMRHIV